MESFLNQVADETAGPFARWYTLAHAMRCDHCAKYLDSLRLMLERLHAERSQPIDTQVQSRLEEALASAANSL